MAKENAKDNIEAGKENRCKGRYGSGNDKGAIRADIDPGGCSVNLFDIEEEDRIIKGIHDIYGKLYNEITTQ